MNSPEVDWALRSFGEFRSIWDPHWACAVLAGHNLLGKKLVEPEATPYVRQVMHGIMERFPIKESESATGTETQDQFLAILAQPDDRVRQLSHDWIYAAYALSAGEPINWSAMIRLTGMLRKSGPGWITINAKNTVVPVPLLSDDKCPDDLLECFIKLERSAQAERADQQLGHVLTHGHAIYQLRRLGLPALATEAGRALASRLKVLQDAHAQEQDVAPFSDLSLNPQTEPFWKLAAEKWTSGHGHLLKYAYSFLELRQTSSVSEPESSRAFCRILCSLG